MRLFVAVNFPSETVEALYEKVLCLKNQASALVPSRKENLHLTIAFIGETDVVEKAKKTIADIEHSAFEITLSGIGKFPRDAGDIYWVGLKRDEGLVRLTELSADISDRLRKSGFEIEKREFSPHVTLARQVMINGEPRIKMPPHTVRVERVSLMSSERIKGKLTYTEIFAVPLGPR